MIVQPTEDNMGFDSNHSDHEDNRNPSLIIIDGVNNALIGGLGASTLFFVVNEVPPPEFLMLTLLNILVMHIGYAYAKNRNGGDDK